MEDIVPQLIEEVTKTFRGLYEKSAKIQTLVKAMEEGTATYADVQAYSLEVSRLIGKAYEAHVSSGTLPDGKMYYNIASRLIPQTLDENHSLVSQYAAKVQKAMNKKAGIGLKAQTADKEQDRVEGMIELAASGEIYDDVAGKLLTAFETYSLSIVDASVKKNADFQYDSGLTPRIIRTSTGKCCDWCRALAGKYSYPDVPRDVWRRHANCRCLVEYDPADGKRKRQNVHTKKWTAPGEADIIEVRKQIGLENVSAFRPKEYDEKIRGLVTVDRQKVTESARKAERHSHAGVYRDAMSKTKKQLQKSIVSRTAQVERHADKIAHPEQYVPDWTEKTSAYREGLLRKWEKDMRRNAEQAEIELAVFEERF